MNSSPSVLIIGGAGYIGSHCNKYFTQKGIGTIILDNLSLGHRYLVKWGTLVVNNIADPDALDQIFSQHKIDTVLHFAAFSHVGESVQEPAKYYQNNVVSTLHLLDKMREYQVKKIIFSSTCATYGVPQHIPITENHPQAPINPYGNTKLAIEFMLKDYCHAYNMSFTSLRYFNAAGADPDGEIGEDHQPETHLIPLVLDAIGGKRKNIQVFGTDYPTKDGTCIRDYIHVTDLAQAHFLAYLRLQKTTHSDVFNLGNGTGFSVMEIINAANHITGKSCEVVMADRRLGDPPVLIGNAAKISQQLGWLPKYSSINTIVGHAWNWHQKILCNSSR